MTGQSKRASVAEAIANTVSGFVLSVILSYCLAPFYGMHQSIVDSFTFVAWFTVVSTLRSYVWRRIFNKGATCLKKAN